MEARLFPEGTIPEYSTAEWYAGRETAPHLEQAGHRERLIEAQRMVDIAVKRGARTAVDLGAGDGGLLSILKPLGINAWGYDLQQTNVDAAANRGSVVSLMDVVAKPENIHWADVVICTEMLEHLIDPHAFVKLVWDSPAKWFVASSPWSETPGSHYEFHLWAWDVVGYREMLEACGWETVEQSASTMAQVILARRP